MIFRHLIQSIKQALVQFPVIGLVGSRQSGKTTLAKKIATEHPGGAAYLDLELPSDLAKLTEPELYLEGLSDKLVILDEIQRVPSLFPILRGLIDRHRVPGRFLVLGSASPALIQQSSETLAGRIKYLELTPFLFPEVMDQNGDEQMTMLRLWLRGGYPESYLAADNDTSMDWRYEFISTFLERDMPQLGFRVSSIQMRRFWEMLAHVHGQVWNASSFARNFDVTAPTIRHHLDILTDALLIRQLQPLHVNLKKRLVKSPKVYIRDTGLLHALLRIVEQDALYGHPCLGASFEGFALEQIIQNIPKFSDVAFYRSHTGAEIDLVITSPNNRRIAVEIKYTAQPRLRRGFQSAMNDLGLTEGYIVTAGHDTFPLGKHTMAVPLPQFLSKHLGEV